MSDALPDPLFRRPDAPALGLILLCAAIELALQGADHHLWGSVLWRSRAYQYGGFWPGLMRGWHPNYAAQPWIMVLTYSFLHAGALHCLGNLLALAGLSNLIGPRLSRAGFLGVWALSVAAGAASFALLSQGRQPMVGLSGGLFGLTGLILAWDLRARRAEGESLTAVLTRALAWGLGLTLLNLAAWGLESGALAWQTHLGGAIAGACWGFFGRGPISPAWQRSGHRRPKAAARNDSS